MWYTSDDYRRFETDLISLQFVTSYRDGVKNARKGEIVPRRQFKSSKSSSNRQVAEEKRWRLHVQRSNKERAKIADRQRADEDRRRRNVELINGVEYQWAPGAISTGSISPLVPTENPYDALKLPATRQSNCAGRDSPVRKEAHHELNAEQVRALDISAPPPIRSSHSRPRPT